jgi:hypothetical protein
MSVVPKTAGLVSPDGMQTPLSPGDIICCPVWVGELLKTKLIYYDGSFIMVRVLASMWNEPCSSCREDMRTSLIWLSPQSGLATGPHFVSPRDYGITRWDTVPPDLVLHLNTNECGAKNCRVSITRWNVNPPYPWGHNLPPTPTSRGFPQEEQLEVPRPPAGVDPDGCVYQAGIRTFCSVRPKQNPPCWSALVPIPIRSLYPWHLGALYNNCAIKLTRPQT